jgi:uncharacterized protein
MSNLRGKPAGHGAPTGDFVFDMRKLGRQPGSMLEQAVTVHAPSGLGSGLASVPSGAAVALDVRFEAVAEGVLVTCSGIAPLGGECGRCLEPLASTIEASFQELYRYEPDPEGDDDADEGLVLAGDRLDLEQAFRDAVVLALPLSPLCREDCPGLCATCGARLADVGPSHVHDEVDPRWDALRGLAEEKNNEVSDSHDRQEG